jgi:hypothetical protein
MLVAALALVCAATALPASAQRELPMTTATAVDKARVVVDARVVDVQVRQQGNIYTFVDFETIAVAKGEVPTRFTYRMLGGRIGDTEVAAGDPMPHFTPGEEVVLFLGPEISSDGYPTLFFSHVYRVTASGSGPKTISPTPTGLDLLARPGVAAGRGSTRLDDFFSAIRKR